tara:strand:+ start:251 stop:535 length:285 start_codon:yes stop_codon:yes gene_type:complete
MDYDTLYRHEIYLGDYRIDWTDQKITVNCNCSHQPELEIFSDTPTVCPYCSRRYSILEIVKIEVPAELEDEDIQHTEEITVDELVNEDRRRRDM